MFRVFLAILRPNLSIFAKFNSKMGSFVLFSTKFNSNIYSFFCFATNSIQKLIQFSFFNKIQFKSWFNSLVFNKIQFKNIFKMLKLAVFNSIKYSFNMKTWVSDRAMAGCLDGQSNMWKLNSKLRGRTSLGPKYFLLIFSLN